MSAEEFKKYICKTCGFIYDEELGDPDSGIAPGTRFEDIPDEWYCPLCLVSKSDFVLLQDKPKPTSMPKTKVASDADVLIIGGGYAGWQAAEAIIKAAPNTVITLLTADEGTVYPKPTLSMALSHGRAVDDIPEASAQEKAFELGISVKPRTKVMSINTARKKVTTTTGSFSYQKLILATGAKALTPQIEAKDCTPHFYTLNDLASYKKFRSALDSAERIAVVGGGLIGTEITEDMASVGKQVHLIARSDHLMHNLLPGPVADQLTQNMRAKGIQVSLGTHITQISADGEGYSLTTQYGDQIKADLLISAIGLKPNIDLAKKLNLDTQRGILINDVCQTSDPDIYALGDCAESKVGLQAYLEPIRRQAATIAQHLAGADTAFVYHPPLVKTKTPSLPIMVCQPFSHTDEWQSLVDSENQHEWRLGSEEKPQGFLYSGKSITKATQAYQNLLAAL